MSLLSDIQEEAKKALRAGEKEAVSAYRMLAAELQRAAKDNRVDELSEEDAVKVLAKERKKRMEAAEAFRGGGREESAAKEEREAELIDRFLPEQLDEAGLARLIDEAIEETGATSPADMGTVMGVVMSRGGTQVDGKVASRLVKERLSG